MRKIAILVPHFKSWRLLAICINAFKQFPFSIDHEIIVCDGSVGHPSIKILTETSLGEGVKIVNGDPELPSHGQGLSLAWEQASPECDFALGCETDGWPLVHGWGEHFIKLADHDLVGPRMALAGGVFVHPCFSMYSRKLIDSMKQWQEAHKEWAFIPSAAIEMGLSDKAYHVVANRNAIKIPEHKLKEVAIWDRAGPWQVMTAMTSDSFDNYWLRSHVDKWEPVEGETSYLRVGFEPGQAIAGYAHTQGFKCFHAPYKVEWMDGRENQQAQFSDVFNGALRHLWAGTSATVVDGLDDEVKCFKREQIDFYWKGVPQKLRHEIELLEAKYA